MLRDRLALHQPLVPIHCPTFACLLCGIGSVERSAIEVARRSGVAATSPTVWTPITTSPAALGGRGPDFVRGHLCPPCADAVDAEGAVGASARGHAALVHVNRTSERKAKRLRSLLIHDFPPPLPAWAAMPLPRVPNIAPRSHLSRVIDRR